MMQMAWSRFRQVPVKYRFKCRTRGVNLVSLSDQIRDEIQSLGELSFSYGDISYLRTLDIFDPLFLDDLSRFQLRPGAVTCGDLHGEFFLEIRGSWYDTILYEVPVLAIIQEVYMRNNHPRLEIEGARRIEEKIKGLKKEVDERSSDSFPYPPTFPFELVEMGTRRRYSYQNQSNVIEMMKNGIPEFLIGTSNVEFAKDFGLKPKGTQAHEYWQICQAMSPSLRNFQQFALDQWMLEFRGKLAVALTDIIGVDAFLRDFDLLHARAYTGLRQDSGDERTWADKVLKHYDLLGVPSKDKSLLFSNGLNLQRAIELKYHYRKQVDHVIACIGTDLTNDVGVPPLQNVIKLVEVNGLPVIKISDDPGKGMCDDNNYAAYVKNVFRLNN